MRTVFCLIMMLTTANDAYIEASMAKLAVNDDATVFRLTFDSEGAELLPIQLPAHAIDLLRQAIDELLGVAPKPRGRAN